MPPDELFAATRQTDLDQAKSLPKKAVDKSGDYYVQTGCMADCAVDWV